MVLAVLEGVSVGSVETERLHDATGYVAFGNVLLYLLGLALLPTARRAVDRDRHRSAGGRGLGAGSLRSSSVLRAASACGPSGVSASSVPRSARASAIRFVWM